MLPTENPLLTDFMSYAMPILMAAPRVIGLHLALPVFGPSSVPPPVRRSLAFSLALFLVPVTVTQGLPESNLLALAALSLKELFLGFAFGFPIALMLSSIQAAGDLISAQAGGGMNTQFDPTTGAETSPIGKILMRFSEVIFFVTGAYTFLLGALFDSYRLWPIASFFPDFSLQGATFFTAAMGKYFAGACLMAFPALACMFLITFCLALIGRYVPQLNVFFIAMPINSLAAMGVMMLCIPIYAHLFDAHFREILESLVGLDKAFGTR